MIVTSPALNMLLMRKVVLCQRVIRVLLEKLITG